MRTFETGATRDDEIQKPDYEGYFSPLSMHRYGEYMAQNQIQPDGSLRASDNWQKMFGNGPNDFDGHKDVCIKSMLRHVHDLQLSHDGFEALAREDAEVACCAIIFNAQAYLYALILEGIK